MKLPAGLRAHSALLTSALATPFLATWDEEQDFHDAEQPAAIGKALIKVLHTELRHAKIGYVYRQKIESRGRITLGKASKVGGKLGYFSDLDLLVEINWGAWARLGDRQRVALIDHELLHFECEITDEGERVYKMRAHDLEEFNDIVARWGLWREDVARMATVIRESDQLDWTTDVANDGGPTAMVDRIMDGVMDLVEEAAATSETGESDTTVTLSSNGRSVTLTDEQFKRAAGAASGKSKKNRNAVQGDDEAAASAEAKSTRKPKGSGKAATAAVVVQ